MAKEYLFNPDLPIIKEGWKGNPMKGRSFINEKPAPIKMADFLKSRLNNPHKEARKNDTYRLGFCPNDDFIKSEDDMIVWLGHASFFIRLGGVTFLTDPSYFGFPTRPRMVPIPCEIDEFKYVDYVLISHMHHDHADTRSLYKIFKGNKKTQALLPLNGGSYLKYFTKNYQEAGWYQQYKTMPGVEVYFLPSFHWSRMHILDSNNKLWGSFIIRCNDKTIYFGGDTAWGSHFEAVAELFPSIDYAILPIGAYTPRSVAEFAHISPDEAAEAAKVLGVKHLIPMHYGTYKMGQEPLGEPYRAICRLDDDGEINCCLNCLDVGEEFLL
ncbi:MBL fold metallo-hydrolase [Methanimicrococcus blatticola]|uniref:L-ascorbate metabolism protein UlaG (Beta-lactamase superfamily) n=1 Tax=Methanimicrococcus blatticola TaxID=91560 RepID=A0A484F7P7_9EURY|nr:MBL fold metallo-hydrolase [Methanimicrococcus blatticola]MBZ3935077.1 MBL fold metallo-hydrolase [Methanimicrococcus blatticola]MCC2508826.1 MBL fold metallo-hydrolase [Methanimicrococcus blatticola]TDQ71145.1 L-ascorbate metabolism protein UlaG (beta-lactamase superfamily) [Methanimicrococcus blatticola]